MAKDKKSLKLVEPNADAETLTPTLPGRLAAAHVNEDELYCAS